MNIGIIMMALLLVAGSIFGVFMIAGQSSQPYVDTFGTVQGNQTNSTVGTITNTTSPIMSAGGGMALIIVVFLLGSAAIVLLGTAFSSRHGRR